MLNCFLPTTRVCIRVSACFCNKGDCWMESMWSNSMQTETTWDFYSLTDKIRLPHKHMSEYVQGVGPTSWHQHGFKIASSKKIWVIWRNFWQLFPRLCTGDSLIKVVTPNNKPSRIEVHYWCHGSTSWPVILTSHTIVERNVNQCLVGNQAGPWAIWERPRAWLQQLHRCVMVYVYYLYIYILLYIIYILYIYYIYTYHICACVAMQCYT